MADDLKECPSCALDVAPEAEVCPYCHYEFPRQRSSVRWVAWLLVVLLAWPVFKLLTMLF